MKPLSPLGRGRRFNGVPASIAIGLALAGFVILGAAVASYRSLRANIETADRVTHTLNVIERIQSLLSNLKDAETGQRGFLLTGLETYLAPYVAAQSALPGEIAALRSQVADSSKQKLWVEALEPIAADKLEELRQTVALRRNNDLEGAMRIVKSDRGKAAMDRIRAITNDMQAEENRLLAERQRAWNEATTTSFVIAMASSAILLLLTGIAGWLLQRGYRERETETWLRAGLAGVSSELLGERRLDVLGERSLAYLSRYLDAPVATFYMPTDDGQALRRFAGFADGRPLASTEQREVRLGEGLVGQVARERRALVVRDLPEGYGEIASSLGHGQVRELYLMPAIADDVLHAVLEFGFLRPLTVDDERLLERVSEAIAVAIRFSREAMRVEALLAETQRQAEELQAQQEELRVTNEELEEQGRALKASQSQLEGQQVELEQSNSQLEEQTQVLEAQKDELSLSKAFLVEKAQELERSNQYKSEFLANMSHELRTPLNSTLILAKLLADNRAGNLTEEQVRFAQTISSAGNDLLTLINDILDLSKIEAGKVELTIEDVPVARVVDGLSATFEGISKEKKLGFEVTVETGAAAQIRTDAQRLAQILRNLLSNAFKFTDAGQVVLRVYAVAGGRIAFAVRDSGIGIAPEQQEIIFEAFRQADGSTHRRYGGTGLGLSISRDLARLLGGDIAIRSVEGEGSTFTLTIPVERASDAETVPEPAPAMPAPAPRRAIAAEPPAIVARTDETETEPDTDDDRRHLQPDARVMLVIEDDVRFARILYDLAHEMGFQCVVTHTAGDGLKAARRYRPSAIVLDMHLPDHSGLGVLDQLKRDPITRHVPVHIASVADHALEARALGAVGYDLKPVPREQLVEAFSGLRDRFLQQMHRVLVVEDDARQLDSIRQLLEAEDVQITGCTSAADALAQLQSSTFDCMVMDLNLPDLSGYELLEKMSARDDVAFPPVIVYTGRSLDRDEEQRLRRYSKSIIIKDARSPERLLDEVTLFLHQVETNLPLERQRMLREVRSRDAALEGRRVLIVEDDVRNVFALSSVLEPKGLKVDIARNGREALDRLDAMTTKTRPPVDLVLMDIMMPEMDGYTAMREIRRQPGFRKLPIIALTAKAMRDDQEKCLEAGANDYIAKPLDVEKLLSLIRVWMPK